MALCGGLGTAEEAWRLGLAGLTLSRAHGIMDCYGRKHLLALPPPLFHMEKLRHSARLPGWHLFFRHYNRLSPSEQD